MRPARVLVALVAWLAAPAAAGATTVDSGSARVLVEARPGEVNAMTVHLDLDRSAVRVRDTAGIGALTTSGGAACARRAADVAECPFPAGGGTGPAFVLELGDRDDRLTLTASTLNSEQLVGAGALSQVRDGPGDDRATSAPSTTTFVTGPGDDVLVGAARATPGGGNDRITGTVGPDVLDGGAGRDVLRGGIGADLLRGGAGGDRLFGEGGQDRLFGGLGDDFLRGGPARDVLAGGPGRDTSIQG